MRILTHSVDEMGMADHVASGTGTDWGNIRWEDT